MDGRIKAVILDIRGTTVISGAEGLKPATSCLVSTLEAARDHGVRVYAVSDECEDSVRHTLDRAGIDGRLVRFPGKTEDLPAEYKRVLHRILEHIHSISDKSLMLRHGIKKIDPMIIVLLRLGYSEEFIREAISGRREIRDVVSIGDGPVESFAAKILGIAHHDVQKHIESRYGSVSRAIREIAKLPILEGTQPQWLAAGRIVPRKGPTTESGMFKLPK